MNNEKVSERTFLMHLITLIQERMNEQTPMSIATNQFEEGKALAYHEIGDFVLECSRIFNLPLADLGITDFDPDRLI